MKYKERYKHNYDCPIEHLWHWNTKHGYPSRVRNVFCKVAALEEHITFEEMKRTLRAEELLAFCKQEMYPVEVLIK